MKWISLLPVLFLTACCCNNYEVVEYRQVLATPTVSTVTVYDEEPIDVTTTSIEYY